MSNPLQHTKLGEFRIYFLAVLISVAERFPDPRILCDGEHSVYF